MRWLVRMVLSGLAIVVLLCAATSFWFFAHSTDLPDLVALARFAPSQPAQASDPCIPGSLKAC